jgi:hypothetical protein
MVDNSYDVPTRYSVDPFTGKNVVVEPGYHIEDKKVVISIKNMPYTEYKDASGHTLEVYYNVQWKGHFSDSWEGHDLPSYLGSYAAASNYVGESSGGQTKLIDPNASYTELPYSVQYNGSSSYNLRIYDVSAGGQIDFQVKTLVGYYITLQTTPNQLDPRTHDYYVFSGQSSGWSDTQTVTIPESSGSVSSSPSPSVPEFPTWIVLPLVLATLIIAITAIKRKH